MKPSTLFVTVAVLSMEARAAGITAEITCEDFCTREEALAGATAVGGVCKSFTREIPKKIGRTCTQKFGQGYGFACRLLCSREESHLSHPWIDRLTHDACQDMSSHIPYPAVFNSCKSGYRNGVTAARAAVSKHLEQQGRSEADENPTHDTTDPVGATATDTKAQRAKRERTKRVLEEDAESWMESLGVPEDYVDYGAVAQERVSAARRTRGSDLARGPACPVCSG